MQQIQLVNLVNKLEPQLATVFENGVKYAFEQKNTKVEIEHCLLQLILNQQSIVNQFLSQQQINSNAVKNELIDSIFSMPKSSAQPVLSEQLITIVKQAWLLASVNYNQHAISELHLFMVSLPTLLKKNASCFVANISIEALKAWIEQDEDHITRLNKTINAGPLSRSQEAEQISTNQKSPKQDLRKQTAPIQGALPRFTINLTEMAINHGIEPIFGRNAEISKTINILCRKRQNNPLLIGAAGVGKTAIVEGLALKIAAAEVPEILLNTQIYALDLTLLQAGASVKGEFEQRLKDVITEVKQSVTPVIMFIDEAHSLIGAGGSAGQSDAANILKPALARGEFRTIAATTLAEYRKYLDKDAALTRRFQKVMIDEPKDEDAIKMLNTVALGLQTHHKVKICDDAIEAAVKLSRRYLPERKLPDKAISLLDAACAQVSLSQQSKPELITELEQNIAYTQTRLIEQQNQQLADCDIQCSDKQAEIDKLQSRLNENKNALAQYEQQHKQEIEIVKKIKLLQQNTSSNHIAISSDSNNDNRDNIHLLRQQLLALQADVPLMLAEVDAQTIAKVLQDWTGIPMGNLVNKEIYQLANLEQQLSQRVIGQNSAKKALVESIKIARTGLKDQRKPIGVYLLCGPSGVGKTETVIALADTCYGGEGALVTINMTEYKEPHKISALIGSPAGYVGYGEGGVLTEAVRRNPYCLLLLDEMEKAHSSIHDLFYQIFDKGQVKDSEGRNVDFRNTTIVMTANAADDVITKICKNTPNINIDDLTQKIMPELQHFFKPAFLGRLKVIPFYPLTKAELSKIIQITLDRLKQRIYQQYQVPFIWGDDFINYIVNKNTHSSIGARGIEQIIEKELMPKLADNFIDNNQVDINNISVVVDSNTGGFNIGLNYN